MLLDNNNNKKPSTALIISSFLLSFSTQSALAQEEDKDHHKHVEEVVVTATPIGRSKFDVVQSTAVLSDDELVAELGGNLGETLDHIPGIANSFFGPGAGRPVVRGLGGDRVRVLIGGIGSIDASSTSPDHAVAGDPLSAQSIEIVRGPATLLYGNNALGGVINLMDGRIPYQKTEAPIEGAFRTIVGSNADEVNVSGAIDVLAGDNFVFHFEGSNRNAQDMTIPSFARTKALRDANPYVDAANEVQNSVPNSHLKTSNYSAGGTAFFEGGYLGFALGKLKNNYGIPVTFEEGGENVRIDLKQTRFDVMGEMNKEFAIYKKAKIRFGYGDYKHQELEGSDIGTTFLNKGFEGRLELVQNTLNLSSDWDMDGAMGVQIKQRKFEAIGDEAFVPANKTTQVGLFIMEEWAKDNSSFQLGSRVEFQDVTTIDKSIKRKFTGVNFSGGVSHHITHEILVGLTAHMTERNPNAEELISNGPHIATQTYELGDHDLVKEKATGAEVTLRKREGAITGSVALYVNSFNNFIYEKFTGAEMDGLPLAQFAQTDALFYGGELELSWQAWESQDYSLNFDLGADLVRAKEKGTNTPLPRIPPHTFTLASELVNEKFSVRLEGEWAGAQNRIDVRETPTEGYFKLDANLTFHPYGEEKDVSLIFQIRNITNSEIRYHTSFLKDLLPAPGRDVRLSLRVGF